MRRNAFARFQEHSYFPARFSLVFYFGRFETTRNVINLLLSAGIQLCMNSFTVVQLLEFSGSFLEKIFERSSQTFAVLRQQHIPKCKNFKFIHDFWLMSHDYCFLKFSLWKLGKRYFFLYWDLTLLKKVQVIEPTWLKAVLRHDLLLHTELQRCIYPLAARKQKADNTCFRFPPFWACGTGDIPKLQCICPSCTPI